MTVDQSLGTLSQHQLRPVSVSQAAMEPNLTCSLPQLHLHSGFMTSPTETPGFGASTEETKEITIILLY